MIIKRTFIKKEYRDLSLMIMVVKEYSIDYLRKCWKIYLKH